jgi:hypothetical protein
MTRRIGRRNITSLNRTLIDNTVVSLSVRVYADAACLKSFFFLLEGIMPRCQTDDAPDVG